VVLEATGEKINKMQKIDEFSLEIHLSLC